MNENTTNTGGALVAQTQPATNGALIRAATPEELKTQINVIQKCMRDLMKEKTHFDCLPGCGDKKTLLKPGAELILTMFRISAEPQIERESDGFDITYRITVIGRHIPTGNVVGYGVGECSTSEKKYKWREAVCDKEYDNTPENRRQIAYIRDKYKKDIINEVKQVRQNPADLTNTVLKMAKKRAIVDLCLTSTACSDIFVQDMDDPDINKDLGNQQGDNKQGGRYSAPQRTNANAAQQQQRPQNNAPVYNNGGGNISEAQGKRLFAIANKIGLSNDEIGYIVWSVAGVNRSDQIPRDAYDAVITAIEAAKHGSVLPPEEGDMF